MVYTAATDALIVGFEAKCFHKGWRPRTAIPRADSDGNPDTDADPTWTPLLQVNHPEYPSAHGFISTAVTRAVRAFFATNSITWTMLGCGRGCIGDIPCATATGSAALSHGMSSRTSSGRCRSVPGWQPQVSLNAILRWAHFGAMFASAPARVLRQVGLR
jgi:hypothetical protein